MEVSTDGANTPFTSRSGNGSLASEISSHGSKKSKAKATFKNKKSKNDSKEVVFLNSNTFIINYPFAKYLECGLKIDLTYAIDLTISNGNFKKDEKFFLLKKGELRFASSCIALQKNIRFVIPYPNSVKFIDKIRFNFNSIKYQLDFIKDTKNSECLVTYSES